jgi:ABC-type phosphate/phosphonate transport system ATPase subunit
MDKRVLETRSVVKYFHDPVDVKVLKEVTFAINRGEFVSIIGKSAAENLHFFISFLLWIRIMKETY